MAIDIRTGLLTALETPTTYGELRQFMKILWGNIQEMHVRYWVLMHVAGFQTLEQQLTATAFADTTAREEDALPAHIATSAVQYLRCLELDDSDEKPLAIRKKAIESLSNSASIKTVA